MRSIARIFITALLITIVSLVVLSRFTKKPPVSQTSETTAVRIYLIKLDDHGKIGTEIGCGDSLVPISKVVPVKPDPVRASLEKLLSINASQAAKEGLYTGLKDSSLSVEKIDVTGETANVYLIGNLSLGGVCDNPRVENQLSSTILQFPQIREVKFFINNKPLSEILSEK